MFTYGFQKYGSRPITYADRGTLTYVEATLLEIQRVANIGRFILIIKMLPTILYNNCLQLKLKSYF